MHACQQDVSATKIVDLVWFHGSFSKEQYDYRAVFKGVVKQMGVTSVYCSVLQCVAVCCSMLQCVALCCSVVQCGAVWCSAVQ